MEAFKYCKREHMAAMLECGAARVGTLFGWRDAGALGEMTGDELEGVIRGSTANIVFYDHRAAVEFEHRDEDTTITVNADGSRSWKTHATRSRDVYTYCLSSTYSHSQHERWAGREGYDACFRVRSCRLFLRALTTAMARSQAVEFFGALPVTYVRGDEQNLVFPGRFHPALLKRAGGYDDQDESRAIWLPRPRESAIAPLLLAETRAGVYCEVQALIG